MKKNPLKKELAKKILLQNLSAEKEEVLIIYDKGMPDYPKNLLSKLVGERYKEAAQELDLKTRTALQNYENLREASEEVIESLKNLPDKSIIILYLSGKLGSIKDVSKSFRKFCRQKGHKFISSSNLSFIPPKNYNRFTNALDTDYEELQRESKRIKKILNNGKKVRIKTKKGTDLKLRIEEADAVANAGDYTEPGTGGNLPAGEVYIPPDPKTAEGELVIDGSTRTEKKTILLKKPIKMTIKNGRIKEVEGEKADLLKKSFRKAENRVKYPERIRMIAELGIGINNSSQVVGCTVLDEKTRGTAHIANGSNTWFGGEISTKVHQDHVFREPEIEVDGSKIKNIGN